MRMKPMKIQIQFFASVVLICICSFAQADSDSASESLGHHGGGGKRAHSKTTENKTAGEIHGSCSIEESTSNPIAGPCVNLVLVLNDSEGKEVLKTRTTAQGQFDFALDSTTNTGSAFQIVPGSKFYEMSSPAALVHLGDRVHIKLKQK